MVDLLGVVVVGTITLAVERKIAQEFEDQAELGWYTPFLVAGSEDSDHLLVPSSQSSDRVLATQRTHVGNDEEPSVVGEHSSVAGQVVVEPRLQPRNQRHETQ